MTERERGKMQAMENLIRYMAGLMVRKEIDNRVSYDDNLSAFLSTGKYTEDEQEELRVSDAFVAGYEAAFSVVSEELKVGRSQPLDPGTLERFPKK